MGRLGLTWNLGALALVTQARLAHGPLRWPMRPWASCPRSSSMPRYEIMGSGIARHRDIRSSGLGCTLARGARPGADRRDRSPSARRLRAPHFQVLAVDFLVVSSLIVARRNARRSSSRQACCGRARPRHAWRLSLASKATPDRRPRPGRPSYSAHPAWINLALAVLSIKLYPLRASLTSSRGGALASLVLIVVVDHSGTRARPSAPQPGRAPYKATPTSILLGADPLHPDVTLSYVPLIIPATEQFINSVLLLRPRRLRAPIDDPSAPTRP